MLMDELRAIELCSRGEHSLIELSRKLGKSYAWTAEVVRNLIKKGFLKKEKKGARSTILLSRENKAIEMKKISGQFSLVKILSGSKEEILISLLEKRTAAEIEKETGFSISEIYSSLVELKETGAVKVEKNQYWTAEELHGLLKLLKEGREYSGVENYAEVIFSNKYKIKKVPKGMKASGIPTSFTSFPEHGVEFIHPSDFYIEPEFKLSIEDILIHSLATTRTKYEMTMCIIFYLKHRDKINVEVLKKKAGEFKVLDSLLDMFSYLEGEETKQKSLFLPWKEFEEKVTLYKIHLVQKFPGGRLEPFLADLGGALETELELFLIGGGNLILRGIKGTTKDLDVIVKSQKEFLVLSKALSKLSFKQAASFELTYKKMDPSAIFEKKNYPRIDLFTKTVCRTLQVTSKMAERSKNTKYKKLNVLLVSPEDIILFKSMTDREGDLEDIHLILTKEPIDWKEILDEIEEQEKLSGRFFSFKLLETFELLEERYNIVVPIKRRLAQKCLRQILLHELQSPKTFKELKEKIKGPGYQLRNLLIRLLKERAIVKIKDKFKSKKKVEFIIEETT